jgi:hypothetical protein
LDSNRANPWPFLASNTSPPIAVAYLSHAQSLWRVFAVVKIKDDLQSLARCLSRSHLSRNHKSFSSTPEVMSLTEVPKDVLIDRIDDDAAVLKALGHDEELTRQFSFFSLAAYATITSNAWVSMIGKVSSSPALTEQRPRSRDHSSLLSTMEEHQVCFMDGRVTMLPCPTPC